MTDSFTYYHCIKTSTYTDLYTCKPFSDPLRIPGPSNGSRIIPIPRWIPQIYHRYAVRRQLRQSIQVTLGDVSGMSGNTDEAIDPVLEDLLRTGTGN